VPGGLLELASHKVGDGNSHMALVRERIERAEPQRQLRLLYGDRAFTVPGTRERTKAEREPDELLNAKDRSNASRALS